MIRMSRRTAGSPEGFKLSSWSSVAGSAAMVTGVKGCPTVARGASSSTVVPGVKDCSTVGGGAGCTTMVTRVAGGSSMMTTMAGGSCVSEPRIARGSCRVGRPRVAEGTTGCTSSVVRMGWPGGSSRSERTRRPGGGRPTVPILSVAVVPVGIGVVTARVRSREITGGVITPVAVVVGRCRGPTSDLVQELVGTTVTSRRTPSRGSTSKKHCPY